ncbi:MAG: hypothetical protein JSS68_11315 [Actinobacteria bacterium]|nr:hypothetical protein [Actinomycetota bacterium]
MGSGIVEAVSRTGLPATVRELDEAALGGAEERPGKSLEWAVARAKIDADLEIKAARENADLDCGHVLA